MRAMNAETMPGAGLKTTPNSRRFDFDPVGDTIRLLLLAIVGAMLVGVYVSASSASSTASDEPEPIAQLGG